MIYFIWAVVGILSCIKKKSKWVMFLTAAFIFCVFAFNTDNPDLSGYNWYYDAIRDGQMPSDMDHMEPVFALSNRLFSALGLDFFAYRTVIVFICLLLISSVIVRFSPYPAWVLFCYSIHPLTLDVTQFRFFIAYSIAFFSFHFIADYQTSKKFKYILRFALCIILAVGTHYACVFYLLFGMLFLDMERHRKFLLVFVPLACAACFLSISSFAPFIRSILGGDKGTWNVSITRTPSLVRLFYVPVMRGALLIFIVFFSFVVRSRKYNAVVGSNENSLGIFHHSRRVWIPFNSERTLRQYDLKINRCLFTAILYIWSFVILELLLSGNYERLSRMGLLLGLVLVSRQISYLKGRNKPIAFTLITAIYGIYFLLLNFFMRSDAGRYFDNVFRRVMQSNVLFGITYSTK